MEECSRGKDLGGRSVKLAKVCEHEGRVLGHNGPSCKH